MKIDHEEYLIRSGEFAESNDFLTAIEDVRKGVRHTTWHSDTEFIINPTVKGNGVVPLKKQLLAHLKECGWQTEVRYTLVEGIRPGPIDAIKTTEKGNFAMEWETGNISSSHRSLNRLTLGLIQGQIVGGVLIVPNRTLYKYLTDRIGNFTELQPYLPIFKHISLPEGVLLIMTIEHDGTSVEAALIPKGQDGNAKKLQ